jgi:hypothetical protein
MAAGLQRVRLLGVRAYLPVGIRIMPQPAAGAPTPPTDLSGAGLSATASVGAEVALAGEEADGKTEKICSYIGGNLCPEETEAVPPEWDQ